jgi:3-mercaptopyruvate sulfurtransferase SseA
MRILLTASAALALSAGVAVAQYKTPSTPPGQTPGAVQVAPNKNVVITPGPSGDDELASARRIERDKAMKLVKEKKAVYVDVRPRDAYEQGHLPGAINIPLGELMNRLKELPPKKLLITYCA